MPAAIERTTICAVEGVRGRIKTLCGVELDIDWCEVEMVDAIPDCPLCVDEQVRRWRESAGD